MEAIKATRHNLQYVLNYVIPGVNWADELEDTIDYNLANSGEWTYVYSKPVGEGPDARKQWFHMIGSKFHETFTFPQGESPYLTMPITRK